MTVGIVFVSHSRQLAEGLVELAAQMAPDVALIAAGGTDDNGIGTSFDRVNTALRLAESGDGVVVLCDLGSAVLTTETALDFLDDDARSRILLVDAPIVEGGVAAAVSAQTGSSRDAVAVAARESASVWRDNSSRQGEPVADEGVSDESGSAPVVRDVTLVNRDGLHARPAADFVKTATTFDARVTVNGTDAKSLLGIMSLGLVKGTTVTLRAEGAQAQEAVTALEALISSGFDEGSERSP
ncbi:dihydroxyacetone kinase phosphoryl donor subunit DhaM [Okibacterium endophyticum]